MTGTTLVQVGEISPRTIGGDEYETLCEAIQLPALPDGYGVTLHLMDGERLTAVVPLGLAGGGIEVARGWLPLPESAP